MRKMENFELMPVFILTMSNMEITIMQFHLLFEKLNVMEVLTETFIICDCGVFGLVRESGKKFCER